jgi:hypothetical protein
MLSKKSNIAALISSVLVLTILKYAVDQSAEALSQILQLIAYASLLIAGGSITLSFCSLLRTFVDGEQWAPSPFSGKVQEQQAIDFFIGFILVAYLSLIRPPIAAYVTFLPYVEWVAIALVVYVIYTMTRSSTEEFYLSSESAGWKEHIQKIWREPGRDLMQTTAIMEQFFDHGVKEPLLVYLTLYLQRLGETEEGILNTLGLLIDYQENARRHKLYSLAFPWTKRKLAMKNKEARDNLLNTLIEKIGGL